MLVFSGRTLQDTTIIDFNMEQLTLHIHGEDEPRALECRYLQPDEETSHEPMTQEQLSEIFVGSGRNGAVSEEEDVEEDNQNDAEDLEVLPENVEAINLIPDALVDVGDGELPEDPHDTGALGDDDDGFGKDVLADFVHQTNDPMSAVIAANHTEQGLDEYVIDEEITYEPVSSHMPAPSSPGPMSENAGSSTDVLAGHSQGLGITPASIRSMLPSTPGCKIQHKTSKTPGRCSGWQAWVSNQQPSRWFSYNSNESIGNHATSQDALQEALRWLWDH